MRNIRRRAAAVLTVTEPPSKSKKQSLDFACFGVGGVIGSTRPLQAGWRRDVSDLNEDPHLGAGLETPSKRTWSGWTTQSVSRHARRVDRHAQAWPVRMAVDAHLHPRRQRPLRGAATLELGSALRGGAVCAQAGPHEPPLASTARALARGRSQSLSNPQISCASLPVGVFGSPEHRLRAARPWAPDRHDRRI